MSSYSLQPGSRTSSRSKKPSNYTKYIQQYHQQILPKVNRRSKAQIQYSNQAPSIATQPKTGTKLRCILSDGRKLNVQIIYSSTKYSSFKPTVIQQKTPLKPKVQQNLLSKFLYAFQQIEKDQKVVENQSVKKDSEEIMIRREPKEVKRKEKDQDDKCQKFYQRIRKLDQKMDEMMETIVYL